MSNNRSESILKSIKSAYRQQFDQNLDDRFLAQVVERELERKREAFLQVQLATSGLSISDMAALKSFLRSNETFTKQVKGIPLAQENKDGLALKEAAHLDAAPEEEDEEYKREKRRAYARAYYHKKKTHHEAVEARPSKKFKTTPEQRAYQRSYYQRKKGEKEVFDNGTLAKAAAKALEAQKKALAKAHQGPRSKKAKIDFDSLAADRTAIDNAFRPGSDDHSAAQRSGASERGGKNNRDSKGVINTLTLNPKTKLRKASNKAGSVNP